VDEKISGVSYHSGTTNSRSRIKKGRKNSKGRGALIAGRDGVDRNLSVKRSTVKVKGDYRVEFSSLVEGETGRRGIQHG